MGNADPLSWLDDSLRSLDEHGLRRRPITRDDAQGPRITVDGKSLLNFGSNDYLGLARDAWSCLDPGVLARGGAGASPLVTGRDAWHERLERALASFEATEAALYFPTGYAANSGTIPALVGPRDIILSDARNHASLIDGCRLSGARVAVYPHRDVDAIEELLKVTTDRRRLIVTDSLFSMDGDVAPLRPIAKLAREHGAMLLVDEAHATGVLGTHGRGVCEELGIEDQVHVRVGTLSKALGGLGGFVVGRRALIDWLVQRARPYFFSTAAPAVIAMAAIEALRIVREEPQRRAALRGKADQLRERLRSRGWDTGDSIGPIIPVMIGDANRTMQLASSLRASGLFVPGIRPPSVPHGRSLLRISLHHGHTDDMLDRLVKAFPTNAALNTEH